MNPKNVYQHFIKLSATYLIALIALAPALAFVGTPRLVLAAGEIEISTWTELAAISDDLAGDYILMNDLGPLDAGYDDFASSTSNGGAGWEPIGDEAERFTGTFDGQGFTITGLAITTTDENGTGLFGHAVGAEIRDLNLADVVIGGSSYSYTGAVVGYADGLKIENVTSTGTINTQGSYVGGLVGFLEDYDSEIESYIRDSHSSVDVITEGGYSGGLVGYARGSSITIDTTYALGDVESTVGGSTLGGLIGYFEDGRVQNSYATGQVTGSTNMYRIGGLIGELDQGLVFDSYALGAVEGYAYVGGLVGESWYGIIANTYAGGLVTSTGGSGVGGLVGRADLGVTYSITGSFWNAEANSGLEAMGNNMSMPIALEGIQSADFENESLFTEMGWDFTKVWTMGEGAPALRGDIEYFSGSGTEEDPYSIATCNDLANARYFFDAHFELANSIDCAETADWHNGAGFMGIAYPFDGYKFTGSFDGNEHTISNLVMDTENSDYVGMFRHIDAGAEIFDLTIENAYIRGDDRVGVLAGGLEGTVTNVHATGEVHGDSNVGGLVGVHADGYGLSNSSPLVYSWDGDSYEYVADVGEMIARGTDGEDFTVIDADKIAPKDDVYSINISQEYNEIVYYDKLSLMRFEHTPGYTVVEPMMREVSYDSLTTVSDVPSNPLLACEDMYGNDCVEDLKDYDNKWSHKDESEVNEWIMDFGDLSDAERIQLVLRAARDYEATPEYDHRTVSVMGPDGEWVQIYGRKELASDGTPRLRTIDLTGKFLTDDYRVKFGFDRLRVNSVAIDTSAEQEFTMEEIAPTKANLSFRGYTAIDKTYFNDHDYETVAPIPPELFANQAGNFTKYGDVLPLITEAEDQFVIMRHGDIVEYEFPYTGEVTPGKEMSYILFSDVVYKHATEETGRTVNPLPYQGMTSYPSDGYPMTPENIEYLTTWNTRVYGGPTAKGSTVIDSSADVDVFGSYSVGGLVGYNRKLITGSFATGYVYGDGSEIGGLVGSNSTDGEITESYSANEFPEDGELIVIGEAPVEGVCYVGGLIGYASGSETTHSYSLSDVHASDCNVGSMVGQLYDSNITKSYAVGSGSGGTVSGNAGGFAGIATNFGIDNSFWNSEGNVGLEACGLEENMDCDEAGSAIGTTTAQLTTRSTFTTVLGENTWDFLDLWGINDADNGGYPFLRWQNFTDGETVQEEQSSGRRRSSARSRVNNLEKAGKKAEAAVVKKEYPNVFSAASVPTSTAASAMGVRNLELGMSGDDVKQLQTILITLGHEIPAGPTGYFGGQTQAALIAYQTKNNIVPAAGYFGSITRAQMKAANVSGLWW